MVFLSVSLRSCVNKLFMKFMLSSVSRSVKISVMRSKFSVEKRRRS